METLYRVILQAEDGQYTLKDGYASEQKAECVADKLASNYGEGQFVFVQPYQRGY